MTYHSDHSPSASRHNSLDQRRNGILDFDHRNTRTEGQAALAFGSGSTAIELDIDIGANALINGNKVDAPPNTVVLSDGHDTLWRLDHIYITTDGSFAVQEGEPQTNKYVTHIANDDGTITEEIRENETAGGPAPKGTDFDATEGELIYDVLVPPGATTSQDLAEQHIHDVRRLAPDVLDLGPPRQPSIVDQYFRIGAGEYAMWPITVHTGQTFRLWEHLVTYRPFGRLETSNLEFHLISYDGTPNEPQTWTDGLDWDQYSVYSPGSLSEWYGSNADDSPLMEVDAGSSQQQFAIILENVSEFTYGGGGALGLQVMHTIESTDDL